MDWLSTFPTQSFSLRLPFQKGPCFFVSFSLVSFLFLKKLILHLVNRPFLDKPKNLLNVIREDCEYLVLPIIQFPPFFSNGWCIITHCQVICLPVPLTSSLVMGLWPMAWKPTEFTPQSQLIWLSHCHKNDQPGSKHGKTSGIEPQLVCRWQHLIWVINACLCYKQLLLWSCLSL